MTQHEQHQLFYQQFNTVVANHAEWLNTPQGTLEVLADPWKRQAPVVKIDHADYSDSNKAADILRMLRARHTTIATQGQSK